MHKRSLGHLRSAYQKCNTTRVQLDINNSVPLFRTQRLLDQPPCMNNRYRWLMPISEENRGWGVGGGGGGKIPSDPRLSQSVRAETIQASRLGTSGGWVSGPQILKQVASDYVGLSQYTSTSRGAGVTYPTFQDRSHIKSSNFQTLGLHSQLPWT